MTTTEPGAFLCLPTELRLQVYDYLIEECLANGPVSDIAGLFHSCCKVNRDLETEYMPKIRPLLWAKFEWEATSLEDGTIGMTLHPSIRARAEDTDICITLPIDSTFQSLLSYKVLKLSIWKLARSLSHALSFPWSRLKLITQSTLLGAVGPSTVRFIYCTLLRYLAPPKRCVPPGMEHTKRLVLVFGGLDEPISPHQFYTLWHTFTRSRTYFKRLSRPRSIDHAWISNTRSEIKEGWSLSLDFEQGLGAVEGALWNVGVHDNMLLAKRLFGPSDNTNLYDSLEYDHRVDLSEGDPSLSNTEDDTDRDSDS